MSLSVTDSDGNKSRTSEIGNSIENIIPRGHRTACRFAQVSVDSQSVPIIPKDESRETWVDPPGDVDVNSSKECLVFGLMKHETPNASYPALTDAMLVSLIELVGRDNFADDLAALLDLHFGHDHFHIFLYRERQAPALLASRPDPISYKRGLENYLSYTYVINPAYRAYRMGREPGVYMISDFIQNDSQSFIDEHKVNVHIEDTEPIGYRTPGWPKNMAEVIMLVGLPNKTMLDFSFLTPLGSCQTKNCKSSLKRLFPILNAILLRQFVINPGSLDAEKTASEQEERFHNFGNDVLTSRERDIAQLILIGHSSNSISLNLGISLPTVKTHRRNIYSKLQISSQAELFNLFLLHLK